MSKKTVRVTLNIYALNDLEVKLGDIFNMYVQALMTTFGQDFGKDARKTAVIVRVLSGLKSTGAAFRSHLMYGILGE